MSTAMLERAFASTRAVLAGIRRDQLADPTPCASWTVAELVNHIVGGAHWFAAQMAGDAPAGDTEPPDFAAGDFLAAFDDGATAAVAAFGAPGALERTVTLPFGAFPGSAFMGLATTDTFTHGWDLARATGQDASDLDPELADQLLAAARATIPDALRGPDGQAPFGPATEVADDASPADRLAAFLGRTV